MDFFVVDTNVAIVANIKSPQANPDCVLWCIDILEKIIQANGVTIDDSMQILAEYMAHLNMGGQPGAGDAFMKWVWQNQRNTDHCEQVKITLVNEDEQSFAEFPQDNRLINFDRSDRKFVAVARASKNHPQILNAVDSDWWDFRQVFEENGVIIYFVCPDQFEND